MTVCAFSMVGLVLDGGAMLRARSDAFAAAGAAARVGAQQLDPAAAVAGQSILDPGAAEHAALDYLAAHDLAGAVTVAGDTVHVTVTTTARLQVLSIAGADTVTFDAQASASAVKVTLP